MNKKSTGRSRASQKKSLKGNSISGKIFPLISSADGAVYEEERYAALFRTGRSFVPVDEKELIPLPFGSVLFMLPGRYPVFRDLRTRENVVQKTNVNGEEIFALSAFLSSGYLRTYLPAYEKSESAPPLSLWAYAGAVFRNGEFYVPAIRIDNDPRSDAELHQNDGKLRKKIKVMEPFINGNRLAAQLVRCATEYRCLCARNFFLSRYEAPIPTTPSCNAGCIGCLSRQEGSGFCASQERISFSPTPEEIAGVMCYHFERVESAVASFGQGCEGEPLLRGKDLAKAIAIVRKKTPRGTINLNTNGSKPGEVKRLIDAGLDSIRISLNSPTKEYYERYFRPKGYSYDDVLRSLEIALEAEIFVSINLFFLPGFTDMESEVESLFKFLKRFPISMIQARNLNIDPDLYLDAIGFRESAPLGIHTLVEMIRAKFPAIKIGYYNPPKEKFN